MQKFSALLFGTVLLAGTASSVQAQSLVSGFMSGKGHGSVVVSGTTERYETVYLAPDKIDGVPIFQEVRVNSVNLYATYGLSDKIDAIVSLPYIQSKGKAMSTVINDLDALYPDAGYANVRQGLQDITGLLKFKSYSREIGGSIIDLLGVVSFSTPMSNYQTNTGYGYIIAIGNRATKYTASGVTHLKTSSGVFATGQVGYSLRTGLVPNALVGEAKVGYAGPKTYIEGFASFQESNGGTDISQEGFTGFFPSTRVNFLRLGASFYRPLAKGVGVVLGASTYVAGRNIGKSTGYSAGISYNF
ncbi:hypothetical protein BEN47_09815 [Hymenobacter lapidarius]|uniref:Uncharacterized protein n=1 Tax=Hymenobacter lapidarius TaxID=1908237 RepID=A0A1G1TAZ3_9BACT|nr:hypothetical protein [Hymenobacter lapidarius]OGX88041.1 hypothetical protein BEN47_09815 [Hymenobacter lapidarius]